MSVKTWHLSKYTELTGTCRVETNNLILSIVNGHMCMYQGDFLLKKVVLANLRKPTSAIKCQALSVFISVPSPKFENKFRFRFDSESDLREVCEILSRFGHIREGAGSQGDAFSQGSPFHNASQDSLFSQKSRKTTGSNPSQKSGSPFLSASQGSAGSLHSQKSSYHSGSQNLSGSPFGSQVSSHYSDAPVSQNVDDSPFGSQHSSQGSIFSHSSQGSSFGLSQGSNGSQGSYHELRPPHRDLSQSLAEFSQYSLPVEPTPSFSTIRAPDPRPSNRFTQPVEPTFSIPPVVHNFERFGGYSQPLPTRSGGYSPSIPSPLVDSPSKPFLPTKTLMEMGTQTDDETELLMNRATKEIITSVSGNRNLKQLIERFSEAVGDEEYRELFDSIRPRKRVAVNLERSHTSSRAQKTPKKIHTGGGDNAENAVVVNEDSEFSPFRAPVTRVISLGRRSSSSRRPPFV